MNGMDILAKDAMNRYREKRNLIVFPREKKTNRTQENGFKNGQLVLKLFFQDSRSRFWLPVAFWQKLRLDTPSQRSMSVPRS